MGNAEMPGSLAEWAKYCDCLENLKRFEHENEPAQASEGESEMEKQLEAPKHVSKRPSLPPSRQETLRTPPPAIVGKSKQTVSRKQNDFLKQLNQSNARNDGSDLSDVSELEPSKKDSDLDIVELEKDRDVRKNEMYRYFNPIFEREKEPKPSNYVTPLIKHQVVPDNLSEVSEVPEMHKTRRSAPQ
jgi:translation initiation factor 2 beta subunit (eIF-2beta)/eIF-5